MNSVSWFLYFVDVVGNLSVLCGITLLMLFFTGALVNVYYLIEEERFNARAFIGFAVPAFLLAFVAVLLPSKNTLYAIAASEVGEKIVKNESVQEITSDATKALHQWIKKQIEPEKK